jgi:Predicted 3'-5' exonuclease related to the exonuclease domain of PolB
LMSGLGKVEEGGCVAALFSEIWVADFEFRADPGEHPWPVCMVAEEVKTGRVIRLWRDELLALDRGPFAVGPDALFVAFFASAEFSCFLELGWPLPLNVLDLYAEHRNETNGEKTPCGDGLLGALALRGLAHIDAGEKEEMRRLILDRQCWSEDEKRRILDYCASDVTGTTSLFSKMAPSIDWPRALLRGRYMKAVAGMERTGTPIDTDLHRRLLGLGMAAEAVVRDALGSGFLKHPLYKIDCIGALVASRQPEGWRMDALGAPNVSERSEAELISSFAERVGQLRPQLITFNGHSFDLPVLRYRAMVNRISAQACKSVSIFTVTPRTPSTCVTCSVHTCQEERSNWTR